MRELVRAGGADDVDAVVNSAKSLEQTGQLVVLIALHVSHCPQTIPISCCSSRNVIPKGRSVLDVLDEIGQATWQDGSYIGSRAGVNISSVFRQWMNVMRLSSSLKPLSLQRRKTIFSVHEETSRSP